MATDLKPMPISSLPNKETLETDDQTIIYSEDDGKAYRSNVGALGAAAQGAISDAFSTTKTYVAGDYVIYNDTLYKFTADKDIGEWDSSIVERTTAAEEIQTNSSLIDELAVSLNDELNNKFIVGTVATGALTIASQDAYNASMSVAKDGYTPIAVAGYATSGTQSSYCLPYILYVNGNTLYYAFRYVWTSTATITITFYIWYMKN